ncbi:hypothetical protein Fcan01_27847 [Folsomia candida]|uniref:Uncharacterized protein n=1 Tax=Folsomia candida TaxID=158441 RepID=A0A226CVH9_FOLCA|nr:hypothetical protein Fcan01_27847 [Folsomia candida]
MRSPAFNKEPVRRRLHSAQFFCGRNKTKSVTTLHFQDMEKVQLTIFFATFAIFLLSSMQTASGQQSQFLSFYNNSTCTGTAFNSTTSNTNFVIPANLTIVYFRVNGL